MGKSRACVLSIAGFDPSGGAGLLADIKTFEQHKVLGMGVVTAITFQNDSEFEGVKWEDLADIKRQIETLRRKFKFAYVKIGMVKDLEVIEQIISCCQLPTADLPDWQTGCRLIWDPILKASTGFKIHEPFNKEKLESILKRIYLITPNTEEVKILSGMADEMEGALELSKYCNVFLKGGHSNKNKGRDYLFLSPPPSGSREGLFPFKPKEISNTVKHGSGCVLSSAITANLANGLSLQRCCLKGKDYATKFLMSNKSLLGYHKI